MELGTFLGIENTFIRPKLTPKQNNLKKQKEKHIY